MRKVAAALILVPVLAALVWWATDGNDREADSSTASAALATPADARDETERSRHERHADSSRAGGDESSTAESEGPGDALTGGLIARSSGSPIVGARVRAYDAREPRHWELGVDFPDTTPIEWTTGSDGRFPLETLPFTRAHLVFEHPDFQPTAVVVDVHRATWTWKLPERHELTVRVEDAAGLPVPGSTVRVRTRDALVRGPVPVAEDGRVALAIGDDTELTVAAPGYVSVQFQPSAHPDDGEALILLARGNSLSGRIVDAAGNPIEGAVIEPDTALARAHSDARGHFHFDGTLYPDASDPPVLQVSADGFETRSLPVRAGDEVITLYRSVPLTGIVCDAEGDPVAGVRVLWRTEHEYREATSGEGGRFELSLPAPGRGRLEVYGPRVTPRNQWTGSASVDVSPAGTDVTLRVERVEPAHLSVRVLDVDGVPVPGGQVRFWAYEDIGRTRVGLLTTDPEGVATIETIGPPGRLLRVEPLEHGSEVPVTHVDLPTVATSGATPVDVRMAPLFEVRLRFLTADREPIDADEWRERADPESTRRLSGDSSGALGRWVRISTAQAIAGSVWGYGRYSVQVDPAALPPPDELGVHHLDVVLPRPAALVGRVILRSGPASNIPVSVTVAPTDGSAEIFDHSVTAADGSFEFGGLPDGEFVCQVMSSAFAQTIAVRTGALAVGEEIDLGRLRLDREEWIDVRVAGPDGSPLVGARVVLQLATSDLILFDDRSDADGRVRLPALDVADAVLLVDAHASLLALARHDSTAVDRVVRVADAVTLHVSLAPQRPGSAQLSVHARVPDTELTVWFQNAEFPADFRGPLRLEALPPGPVRLVLTTTDEDGAALTSTTELELTAGETRRITLPAPTKAR